MISTPYQAETGKWYASVEANGIRQEFKFDHEPTETDLAFALAELFRQHFPIDDSIINREIELDGIG